MEEVAVISDESEARARLAAILAAGGYRPLLLAEAWGAFPALARDPPAAIVLDLRLGAVRSYMILLWHLRMTPPLRAVPVVVCAPADPALSDAAADLTALNGTLLAMPSAADELLVALKTPLGAPAGRLAGIRHEARRPGGAQDARAPRKRPAHE